MKKVIKLIILLVAFSILTPNLSYSFGLFQYTFDGIKNQLGLDRGPVSKVVPQDDPSNPYCHPNMPPNVLAPKPHPDRNRIVIQAEGF